MSKSVLNSFQSCREFLWKGHITYIVESGFDQVRQVESKFQVCLFYTVVLEDVFFQQSAEGDDFITEIHKEIFVSVVNNIGEDSEVFICFILANGLLDSLQQTDKELLLGKVLAHFICFLRLLPEFTVI